LAVEEDAKIVVLDETAGDDALQVVVPAGKFFSYALEGEVEEGWLADDVDLLPANLFERLLQKGEVASQGWVALGADHEAAELEPALLVHAQRPIPRAPVQDLNPQVSPIGLVVEPVFFGDTTGGFQKRGKLALVPHSGVVVFVGVDERGDVLEKVWVVATEPREHLAFPQIYAGVAEAWGTAVIVYRNEFVELYAFLVVFCFILRCGPIEFGFARWGSGWYGLG